MTEAAAAFWNDMYEARPRVWSGRPNAALVRVAADLPPGTALDLGCGEGGDALWLAERGWRVTAVDISQVALDRAAEQAGSVGLGDRIDWRRHDLAASFPSGTFDLVSAQFLHAPAEVEFPRDRVLRDAAAAVAPGGHLLVVGHADMPPWSQHHVEDEHLADLLPSAQQVWDALALPSRDWHPRLVETASREATGPDGQTATLSDAVVLAQRTA
jgi:SAM-dependent methyltransferase